MRIIGLGHRKRVGKDTAAKFIMSDIRMNHQHINSQTMGFSRAIKRASCIMYAWGGLMDEVYYDNHPDEIEQVLPRLGKSPRNIWDEMGLKGREIHPKTWVEAAVYDIDADLLVIAGVRFPTEIDLIRGFGGLLLEIERPCVPHAGTEVDEALADFEGWDATIINDCSLKEFRQKILQIVTPYLDREFPPE